jgi:DNA-binding transcriptional MocR family regulator
MRDALALGRECGLVYGVMWEAAWHDQRGDCGGTTELSHKALADLCHMSKTTVIRAVDRLLDDGLIQFLHMVPTQSGSWKRRYRVTHPDHVEAQRAAIEVFGIAPSDRAKRMTHYAGEAGMDDDVCLEEQP